MVEHGRQEPVSMAGDRFDVSRALRRISKSETQLGHCFIEAAVKINESMGWPEPLPELVSRYHLTGMVQEKAENLEGLFLKLDPNAALAKFSRPDVQFENAEAASLRATLCRLHRHTPLA